MKQSVKVFLAVIMLLSSVAFNFVAQASDSSGEDMRNYPTTSSRVNSDDYDTEDEYPDDIDSDNEEDDSGDDSDGDAGDIDE